MKNYKQFLEEISIKGNQGIPKDPDYLKNVEKRAKSKLGLTGDEDPKQLGPEIMRLVDISRKSIIGKEKQLEELAEKIIRNEYGKILDQVELDIKIIKPGGQKDIMPEEEGEPEMPSYKLLNDPEIRKEVDKAKLANNIIQGEAKNTKHILHSDDVKEGLKEIFGEEEFKKIFDIWDKITKLADKMDWIIPIEIKAHMMEEDPMGFAGAVKVEWKPKDKKEEEEDLAEKILKSIEKGDDLKENEEDIAELFDETTPVIHARGVDFPMLLHETVKGIYELIAANGIPDDKRTAEIVKLNTSSFEDEAEDFRYGPEIAADLRDFVVSVIEERSKKDEDVRKHEKNLRAFIFGEMVDRNYMSADEFLKLFKSILLKESAAKKKISSIIDLVISKIKEDEAEREEGSYTEEEPEPRQKEKEEPKEKKKLQLGEINTQIDAALDIEDYKEVERLSKLKQELYPGR